MTDYQYTAARSCWIAKSGRKVSDLAIQCEPLRSTDYRKYYRNLWLVGMSEDETDQMKGLPLPPMQKPYPEDAKLLDLVATKDMTIGQVPLIEAIENRRSRRKYTDESLSLEELSFLLWCTQGSRDWCAMDC